MYRGGAHGCEQRAGACIAEVRMYLGGAHVSRGCACIAEVRMYRSAFCAQACIAEELVPAHVSRRRSCRCMYRGGVHVSQCVLRPGMYRGGARAGVCIAEVLVSFFFYTCFCFLYVFGVETAAPLPLAYVNIVFGVQRRSIE